MVEICCFYRLRIILRRKTNTKNRKNMKKILLAAMMLVFVSSIASAQRYCAKNRQNGNGHEHDAPLPHRSIRLHKPVVSYDEASTILMVKFSSSSHGGMVDVYRDGEKVAGVTANSGTTFSCILREYGDGNYNVIVSNGNTVIYSKNFTVR